MNKRVKKLISMMLCFIMLIGVLPLSAFAEEATSPVTNGQYTGDVWAASDTGSATYVVDETNVTLSKTAAPVEGMENTFDITLTVQTSTSTSQRTDGGAVVLVIDVSGSMNYCAECGESSRHDSECKHYKSNGRENGVKADQSRIAAAKTAAKNFLAAYAGTHAAANRQLAIVTFATRYNTVMDWTNVAGGAGQNGYNTAYQKIDDLGANGGTNLEGGLSLAKELYTNSTVANIESKSVITLTDGVPTYRIGDGDGRNGSSANNNAAANQATAIKNAGANLYTVCFGVANERTYEGGPTVGNFLRDSVASSGCAYNADNSTELNNAFKAITESITSGLSGDGWTATDPMADKISVVGTPPENFTTEDGSNYTWTLSDPTTSTSGNTTTYTYTCTYRVELDVQSVGFEENKYYPTNGPTYLNIDGEQYAFPVPGVQGVLPRTDVTVTKEWVDEDNRDGMQPDSVTVRLTEDGVAISEDVVLNESNGWTYTWTDLIEMSEGSYHNYSVEEDPIEGYTASATNSSDGNFDLVITNTHEIEKDDITVTKKWVDADNQDGIRPSAIKVKLLADGIVVGSAELKADDWTYTFQGFPVNREGKVGEAIVYTVEEEAVAGYEASYNGLAITNTHTPEKTSVSVTKSWQDNSDQDGIRPKDITVKLLADGADTGKTLTLNADNNWSGSFAELDKFKSGKEIEYTVAEVSVTGYTSAISGSQADGYTITNTHTPEVTKVAGSKEWVDNDDQDGARPESITINLVKDGKVIDTKTVTKDDNWSWSFDNLPKYENGGNEIVYSITEEAVAGYTAEYNGYDVTNTHTPDQTSVTVTKSWQDNYNQDGIRPNDITVKLLADGVDTGKTLVLSQGNNWTGSFTALDKYAAGEPIDYTVEELAVEGYNTVITGTQSAGYTITNTHTPEVFDITGSKFWEDNDDQDGARPQAITVNLLANGDIVATAEVTAEDDWTWTFSELPKYENGGNEIVYVITEEAVEDYSAEYDGYDVINTHTPEKTSVTVTKAWADSNDQDGIRPENVTVVLLANGEETQNTLKLNADNNWTGSFTELDKFAAGEEIVYSVKEVEVEGYSTVIAGDQKEGFVITNTHAVELTAVEGGKTWDDNDNQDGARPASITVNLLANGKVVNTLEVTADDDWSWSFTNLPKYENGGNEIVYTITENAVEGYTTSYDGFDVINSYDPEKISVTVNKAWADSNDAEGIRPDKVTIKLYANGEDTGLTLTLNEGNSWKGTFADLDKFADGKQIEYTVVELAVKGYNTVVTGSAEKGFIVTNSHTYIPQTGDERTPVLWISLMAVSMLMITFAVTGVGKKKRSSK